MKLHVLLLIFCFLTNLAYSAELAEFPEPFHGIWDANQDTCEEEWSEARIVINQSFIEYWESQGKIIGLLESEPFRIKVNLKMIGEGEKWFAIRTYALSKELDTVTDYYDGVSSLRVRCAKRA